MVDQQNEIETDLKSEFSGLVHVFHESLDSNSDADTITENRLIFRPVRLGPKQFWRNHQKSETNVYLNDLNINNKHNV